MANRLFIILLAFTLSKAEFLMDDCMFSGYISANHMSKQTFFFTTPESFRSSVEYKDNHITIKFDKEIK